jgi:hypothetical protein
MAAEGRSISDCARTSDLGRSCTIISGNNSPKRVSVCATPACISGRGTGLAALLTLTDLRPCPWNLFHRPHSWFDLFMRAEREPPRNLTEWRSAANDLGIAPLSFPEVSKSGAVR